MDALTRQIFRSLQWPLGNDLGYGLRPTYWSISKKLGVRPRAVKARLDKLTSSKVISHLRVVPDVSLFGLKRTGVITVMSAMVVEKTKEKMSLFDFLEAVHIARPVHVPLEITNHWDPFDSFFVWLDIIHKKDSDLKRLLALLGEVIGEFHQIYTTSYSFDPRQLPLLPDAKIRVLRELVRLPFAEIRHIAIGASLSEGSVRKYMHELASSKAYFYEPVIDATKMDSTPFMVGIRVAVEDRGRMVARLKELLSENWLLEDIGSERTAELICVADNLSEAERLFGCLKNVKELADSMMLVGVQNTDNQVNISYLN